jgi:hypothetical protein
MPSLTSVIEMIGMNRANSENNITNHAKLPTPLKTNARAGSIVLYTGMQSEYVSAIPTSRRGSPPYIPTGISCTQARTPSIRIDRAVVRGTVTGCLGCLRA